MNYNEYLESEPYTCAHEEKHLKLTEILKELTKRHKDLCPAYARILSSIGYDENSITEYEDIPFLAVRLFKEYELKSVSDGAVVKTMTSSGTTGQQVSRIYLDKETSTNQQKIMTKIVSDFIGKKRLPMIIIDSSTVLKDRNSFSARGAGILGFSMFGRDKFYAFDENRELDIEGMNDFLMKHKDEDVLLFGFTFIIWKHFYKKLLTVEPENRPDLSSGILIHGGGWKKLQSESVSPTVFRQCLHEVCGIDTGRVHDYYGMVEQTGTIYMECECGHLHTSVFSDVIIRNPEDWSVQPNGLKGLIEVVSALPLSYPGHALLTEDEGVVDGEDDCPCGRKGKYFRVLGRIKNAEIRGCSDTYADRFSRG